MPRKIANSVPPTTSDTPPKRPWTSVQFEGGATAEMRKELLEKQSENMQDRQYQGIVQIFEELASYAHGNIVSKTPRYQTFLDHFKDLVSTVDCAARSFSQDEVILWSILEVQDTGVANNELDEWLQHEATIDEVFQEIKATLACDRIQSRKRFNLLLRNNGVDPKHVRGNILRNLIEAVAVEDGFVKSQE